MITAITYPKLPKKVTPQWMRRQGRCIENRKNAEGALSLNTGKNANSLDLARFCSKIEQEVVQSYLKAELAPTMDFADLQADIYEFLMNRIVSECFEFLSPEQKNRKVKEMSLNCARYLYNEDRQPLNAPWIDILYGVSVKTTTVINPEWTPEEKKEASRQLAKSGVIYLDAFDCPVDKTAFERTRKKETEEESILSLRKAYWKEQKIEEAADMEDSETDIEVPDVSIMVKPDAVFYFMDKKIVSVKKKVEMEDKKGKKLKRELTFYEAENYPVLEIVMKYNFKVPDVLKTTTTDDSSLQTTPGTYAYILYGRELMKRMGLTGCTLRVSNYYFRSREDNRNFKTEGYFERFWTVTEKQDKNKFEPPVIIDKYHQMEMVISLEDSGAATDKHFVPIVEKFFAGKEKDSCTKNDCEKCQFSFQCVDYKKPPLKLEDTPVSRAAASALLTRTQEEIINVREGFWLCDAGAGTGKTFTMVLRAVTMIDEGIDPASIYLFSYTNVAAQELRDRIRSYLDAYDLDPELADKIHIMTFHSFRYALIRDFYKEFGFISMPYPVKDPEKYAMIADIINEKVVANLDYKNFGMNEVNAKGALLETAIAFDLIKKNGYSIGDEEELIKAMLDAGCLNLSGLNVTTEDGYTMALSEAVSEAMKAEMSKEEIDRLKLEAVTAHYTQTACQLLELYSDFDDTMKQHNLLDFIDMETLMDQKLEQDPYFFEDMGVSHIIVDEAQDTSRIQARFVKAMTDTPSFKSLMLVGDDDQCIMDGVSDSNVELFINPDAVYGRKFNIVRMEENFRCSPQIIELANAQSKTITGRISKALISTRPDGEPVHIAGPFNKSSEENEYILEKLKLLHDEKGIAYEDMAILLRSRTECAAWCDRLTDNNIPSVMKAPMYVTENTRVSAALALIEYWFDRGATRSAAEYLNVLSKNELSIQTSSLSRDIRLLSNELYDIERKNSFTMFKDMVEGLDPEGQDEIFTRFKDDLFSRDSLSAVLDYGMDYIHFGNGQTDKTKDRYPGVEVCTTHSYKGLEKKAVFLSVSKFQKMGKSITDSDRRLLFVGITRAKDILYVTGTKYVGTGRSNEYLNLLTANMLELGETLGADVYAVPEPEKKEKKKTGKTVKTA